jgi:PAS domain-containing protein
MATVREGLLVLDSDLTIRFANRSFCDTFAVKPDDAVGQKLYEVGNGQWDIPELRTVLETVIAAGKSIETFEVDRSFSSIGRRAMVLNARQVYRPGNKICQIASKCDPFSRPRMTPLTEPRPASRSPT